MIKIINLLMSKVINIIQKMKKKNLVKKIKELMIVLNQKYQLKLIQIISIVKIGKMIPEFILISIKLRILVEY
jgi:hypothetical protein